jgi:hypothetical protein
MISKNIRCLELKKRGYIEIVKTNNEDYDGQDMFFCPQAPDLYMLYFNGDNALIERRGTSGFRAKLSTKVKSISDIDVLNNEIDRVIINQDESSFTGKYKSTGCMFSVLAIILSTCFVINLLA